MYYLLIVLSTLLFSLSFLFKSTYQKSEGADLVKSSILIFIGAAFSIIMLFCLEKGELSFSGFSFVIALISAINGIVNTIMSIKVFAMANLTIYSLFSMIGGMLLPFVFSIAFYGEPLTAKKVICVVLLIIALFIGNPIVNEKEKNNIKAFICYFLVFFTNGLSGVLSKIHQTGAQAVSGNSYTFMQKTIILLISLAFLIYFLVKKRSVKLEYPIKSNILIVGSSILNTIGNLILLFALLFVDASIQYPLVTGGVMVISVLFDFVTGKKPTLRSIVSVVISCVSMCLLAI